MNRAALLHFLVLCTASGAFLHHLTGAGAGGLRKSGHRSAPGARSARDNATAFSRQGTAGMADALLAAAPKNGEVNWILLDERLNVIEPGDYLLVIRELQGRDDQFLVSGEPLRTALVQRAAAADARGLLAFAEEAFRLEAVVGECFRHDPDVVLAAILRLEATGNDEEKAKGRTNGLLMAALSAGVTDDPVATLHRLERAGFLDRNRIPYREGTTVASENHLSMLPGSFHSGGSGGLGGLPARNFANGPEVFSLYAAAITSWARQDPSAALEFASKHPSLLPEAVFAWAGSNVEAAAAWVRESRKREALVFANAGYGDAEYEPPERAMDRLYLEYARKHPLDSVRMLDRVSNPWLLLVCSVEGIKSEPLETSTAWVRTLPVNLPQQVSEIILENLQEMDQERALAFCRKFPEAIYSLAGREVLQSEARRDPVATAQFVQSASLSDETREWALSATMEEWREIDPVAAQRYVESLPPSEVQGRLLMENSQVRQEETTEAALALAMKLPHLSQRIGAVRSIFSGDPFSDSTSIDRVPDAAVREALRTPMPEPAPGPEEEATDAGAGNPFAAPAADPFQSK